MSSIRIKNKVSKRQNTKPVVGQEMYTSYTLNPAAESIQSCLIMRYIILKVEKNRIYFVTPSHTREEWKDIKEWEVTLFSTYEEAVKAHKNRYKVHCKKEYKKKYRRSIKNEKF